mgnify:CR=1 FL=1
MTMQAPQQLYAASPESLARSRKAALERMQEYEKFYWDWKLARLDSFFDQKPDDRLRFYLEHEPGIVGFFAKLADQGPNQSRRAADMAADYRKLLKTKLGITE